MPTNPDFSDLFSELSAAGADFSVGGAHAVMFYASPRYTKDLDIRIDIVTSITGVDFAAAWERRVVTTYGQVPIQVLAIEDLMTNKRAVGRPQDLIDLEHLERARRR